MKESGSLLKVIKDTLNTPLCQLKNHYSHSHISGISIDPSKQVRPVGAF